MPQQKLCQLANTPFIVDSFWQSMRRPYRFQPVFFLTHCHADHISGIEPGWEVGPLYLTAVTQRLLMRKVPGLDPTVMVGDDAACVSAACLRGPCSAARLRFECRGCRRCWRWTHQQLSCCLAIKVREFLSRLLPLMPTTALVPPCCCSKATSECTSTRVTSGMCRCIVQFTVAVRGFSRSALSVCGHVCRFHDAMAVHPSLRGVTIDRLYLDNTFFHSSYEFVSDADSVRRAVSVVRAHPKRRFVITTEMLGKERFCYDIGKVRVSAVDGSVMCFGAVVYCVSDSCQL